MNNYIINNVIIKYTTDNVDLSVTTNTLDFVSFTANVTKKAKYCRKATRNLNYEKLIGCSQLKYTRLPTIARVPCAEERMNCGGWSGYTRKPPPLSR